MSITVATQLTILRDFLPAGFSTAAFSAGATFSVRFSRLNSNCKPQFPQCLAPGYNGDRQFGHQTVLGASTAGCCWFQLSDMPQFPQRTDPGYTSERQFGHQGVLVAIDAGCCWFQLSDMPQFPQCLAPGYTMERQFGHQAALAEFAVRCC